MVNTLKIAAVVISVSALAPSGALGLDFKILEHQSTARYIRASGTISVGDAAVLRGLLGVDGKKSVIVFNSDGGSVTEALKIGRDLRRNGTDTFVPSDARCLSACILAFVGGAHRTVSDTGALGSHQFYWPAGEAPAGDEATSLTQQLSASVLRHFIALDVDPEALTLIMETPPAKMLVFNTALLKRFRLVGTASASERPAVSPEGEKRVGCPFPESYINNDPLNLYPACKH
ncbi:hypothetical protein GGQ73_003047 [Rhizobium skierniewicense]|uniref:Periplasmic protein-like protein n=1 Tax=Rhizobium skierniewicense TaxID=984260 RepID=A0A7W6CB04_9HYPH|nr:hypothetical protein [Rhizobium skierniewicense]MBB3947083.1 hypothetical protein [Rhizobium skierniewicense]